MTWADVALGLVRWIKAVVCRLGEGSRVVAWRIGRWPAKPIPAPAPEPAEGDEQPQPEEQGEPTERGGAMVLLRWGWLIFLAWLTWSSVQRSHPLAGLLAAGWAWESWRAGGQASDHVADTRKAITEAEEPADELPAPSPEEQRTFVLGVIVGLIGDRNGVHCTDIRDELVRLGSIPAGLRIADIRARLQRLGIPVRDQLKIGRANRPGVHREDLAVVAGGEAAPTPPPLSLVKDPGSSAA